MAVDGVGTSPAGASGPRGDGRGDAPTREGASTPEGAFDPMAPAVVAYLGAAHAKVSAYANLLAAEGELRGLIGPREVPRLWTRHILNCAAVSAFLPQEGTLVDVGSGAGLPGVVLAALRPRMNVVLVEPMARRTTWLQEVVDKVGLPNVRVMRGRANDFHEAVLADVVTARAVAPLDRLAGWTLPFLGIGGVLLAMKGQSAADELVVAREHLHAYGGDAGELLQAGAAGMEPTTVVRVRRVAERTPTDDGARTKRRRA
jgi:16S rRNA (guanine527-N7)-methyltransferase